jgi:hypothetical protein
MPWLVAIPVAPQNLIRERSLRPDVTVPKKYFSEAKENAIVSCVVGDSSSRPNHS